MSTPPAVKTAPLPVSILSGPSAPALLQELGAIHSQTRIGLLTVEASDGEIRRQELPNFVIERLSSSPGGAGHDPAQLRRQIRTMAERGKVDHLLIECDPATPAMAFASLFLPDGGASQSLADVAQLTTAVVVLDAADLLASLVHRRETMAAASPCFIAEQIEFASHIVLESGQDEDRFGLARAIVSALNPRAHVSKFSPTMAWDFLHPRDCFDFAAALDGAGWRKLVEGEKMPDRNDNEHVGTLAYHAWKPFHPARFWNFLQGGTPGIFRAKGFFWLATRMDLVGGLNLAGSECHMAAAGEWWAAREKDVREANMPERTRKEWRDPFGDRRQAIAIMGIDFDPDAVRAQLDACLLTESEAAAGVESWQSFSDPFPCWSHHDHGHDHHHECGDSDCCHH